MAEPQANTQTEQSRGKENAGQASGARGEARSFEHAEARRGDGPMAQAAEQVVQAAADSGRQIAETGRRAMTEAMRHTFDPFLAMQFDMNRWFDDMWRQTLGFRPTQGMQALRPFGPLGAANLFGLPATDLQETDQAHVLAIELPGLSRDDVDVAIENDVLTICGHKAEEKEDASATYRVSERRFGRFERSFPLPSDVDRSAIQAQFRDGVLKITLPRDARAAPRRSKIAIKG